MFLPPVLGEVPPLPLVVGRRLLHLLLLLVEPVHLGEVVRARLSHVVVIVPVLLHQLGALPELLLLELLLLLLLE